MLETIKHRVRQALWLISIFGLLFVACDPDSSIPTGTRGVGSDDGLISEASGSGSDNGHGSGQGPDPGTITAGEWNDLENWSLWDSLMSDQAYSGMPSYWQIYPLRRVSVQLLTGTGVPANNVEVSLSTNQNILWSTRSDNFGRAELWVDLFQPGSLIQPEALRLEAGDGTSLLDTLNLFEQGRNIITLSAPSPPALVQVAFVVDATGSMSDELEYLKVELQDVIDSLYALNSTLMLSTGAVFYRDLGDDYVTRVSNFSSDETVTIDFIQGQAASGGGDYPEAVHSAMSEALLTLEWSTEAQTRIMFMLLDAPPHYNQTVIDQIKVYIRLAAAKGVKIIPVSASGVNRETEFLLRFMAIATNGTYVFITDDSGIGGEHLQPTVGEYQVEFLNHLMVRLINKYINQGVAGSGG